ncbi:MAG: A/G-specific adenine glycosylase [Candidatus Sericytochromatia bacterium]|nr:A/G-specific adenine glycosylase [Candidatus Sericytochromatia bacterium]
MPDVRTLAGRLFPWFDRVARPLPWRGCGDAWGILVSEVMLQQTQVATVIPYWLAFMERFPTPAALASATEREVLKAWEGLGYYRRARMLQSTALALVTRCGGSLPPDLEALRALPGLGPYTSAAVASLAFGVPAAAVDGNVLRVWARWSGDTRDIGLEKTRKAVAAALQGGVPTSRPGAFNEALMELGATVCTPRSPRCDACPLAEDCVARAEGRQAALPVKHARTKVRSVVMVQVVLEGPAGVWIRRAPADGLLGGMTTWPMRVLEVAHPPEALSSPPDSILAAQAEICRSLGADPCTHKLLHRHRFRFTHLDADIWTFLVTAVDLDAVRDTEGEWVPREALGQLPWPAALQPVRDRLLPVVAP